MTLRQLFLPLLLTIALPCAAQVTFVRGDANDDGVVDISDPVAILQYQFLGGASPCLDAMDLEDNGAIDLGDPMAALAYLFSAGPVPSPPFPTCGADVTADSLDCVGPFSSCAPATPANIVLIVADDFGVDLVNAYGEAPSPPCTPHLDTLASQGMLFRNAWSYPTCSPTRAAIQTGRHGFRNGIGEVVTPQTAGLDLAETTLPELLVGYSSTYLGKWHLSGNLGNSHPNDSGFDDFAGTLRGAVPDYFDWTKFTNGLPSPTTTYATTDTADDAVNALQTLNEPFFLQISFHAPHDPFHVPPAALCATPSPCATSWCATVLANSPTPDLVKGATEAMDTEIGRVLEQVDFSNTWVFFIGDNGTARMASQAPFAPMHAKGSVYEGGVNVPLIVRGPGVAVAECAGLVSCTDLFATFAEIAGVSSNAEDSVSMLPYFSNPLLSIRDTVYAEAFSPNNGALPFTDHSRAVRNQQYKLIRITGEPDEFYDLLADPFETDNLLPVLTPGQQAAFDTLLAQLVALGVD